MNERQHTTRYIQNGRDCTKVKGSIPLQYRNGLIGLSPQSPTFAYTHPLPAS